MSKKGIILSIIIAIIGFCNAQNVTQQEAQLVAAAFFDNQDKHFEKCAKIISKNDENLLYIFNADNAFVVISGDKSAQPILAFVENQIYNDSDTIAPFMMWLNNYSLQIENIKKNGIIQPQFVEKWDKILSNGIKNRTNNEILPLLKSKWDQGEYYNYYCPKDFNGPNYRVVTGCVATAMAQLMYYFRYPQHGTGSYSYVNENYGEQYANYGEATYNYNEMCDQPTSINKEIAKLMYHCGVGVDMVYGPDGSGMFNHSAAKVLRTYFGFSPQTEYLFRDSTDLNWDSVIVSHLEKKIPLYYAGWSNPNINGHGFICDGYKIVEDNYYFHFNFGWSGSMDGYFYTNSLYVGGSNFNLAQELIVNATPSLSEPSFENEYFLTSREGTFTDNYDEPYFDNYAKNLDLKWHISSNEPNVNSYSFTIDYSIEKGDTLTVTDRGNPENSIFITADTGSVSISWNNTMISDNENDIIDVRFTTDDEFESSGFRFHYRADLEEFCSGSKVFSQSSGSFSDGSDEADYNNLSNCRFNIILPSHNAIAVHINKLDLEEGHDYLSFFNNKIAESSLYFNLSGHIEDTTFVFDTKRLFIIFETDEVGTADGFDINYYGLTGVDEYENNLTVKPNPATSYIEINNSKKIDKYEIFDAQGRLVISGFPQSEAFKIPLHDLKSGYYTIILKSENSTITRKFIKI